MTYVFTAIWGAVTAISLILFYVLTTSILALPAEFRAVGIVLLLFAVLRMVSSVVLYLERRYRLRAEAEAWNELISKVERDNAAFASRALFENNGDEPPKLH